MESLSFPLADIGSIANQIVAHAQNPAFGSYLRRSTVVHWLPPLIMLVALVFRTVDAFRVFDVIYVMTGGGPGTATEPIAMYTFSALLENLRFGYGSALSVVIFGVTFLLALVAIRLIGRGALVERAS